MHTNLPGNATRKRCEKIMIWMSSLFEKGKGCAWIIEDRFTSYPLGAIRINSMNKSSRYGDIGYELNPAVWRRGYMTEALIQVVDVGHDIFELNRLEAWTVPGNSALDSVLEKAGFQFEGTFRQKEFYKGVFHDLKMYGRLASDRRTHQ